MEQKKNAEQKSKEIKNYKWQEYGLLLNYSVEKSGQGKPH